MEKPKLKHLGTSPRILPPVAWGGSLPSGSFRSHIPERITILHSGETLSPGINMLAYIKKLQQRDIKRGWGDLGAHYYVDPSGVIYQSRRIFLKGHIAEGKELDTVGHVLVMLFGDYNTPPVTLDENLEPEKQEPLLTDPIKEQMIELLGWLCVHFEIPLESINGLNEYVSTDSPGDQVIEWLNSPDFEIELKKFMKIPIETPEEESQ